jgi:hypothetical protein
MPQKGRAAVKSRGAKETTQVVPDEMRDLRAPLHSGKILTRVIPNAVRDLHFGYMAVRFKCTVCMKDPSLCPCLSSRQSEATRDPSSFRARSDSAAAAVFNQGKVSVVPHLSRISAAAQFARELPVFSGSEFQLRHGIYTAIGALAPEERFRSFSEIDLAAGISHCKSSRRLPKVSARQ